MTPTEEFVSKLCENTFLPFWSFPNPIGKKLDKELCDILVVCDPDIIIFSVKEIIIKDSGNYDVDAGRWERKAIDDSVAQIYGAERIIQQKEEIVLKDKITKINLPEKGIRNIYRIAVAFGRGEKFSIKFGDFGKGYVHAFDEMSIQILLNELDTIADFIDFLKAKEEFIKKGIAQIAFSEEDYLAMYLNNSFDIPEDTDMILLDGESWKGFSKSEHYLNEKKENENSYLWDSIIENLYKDFQADNLIETVSRTDLEKALRLMNKETRFNRRQFSKSIMQVVSHDSYNAKVKARIFSANVDDAPLYVVMTRPETDREFGRKELYLRCLVARSLFQNNTKVIGLATEPYQKNKGYSLDLYYLDLTIWSELQQKEAEAIKEDLGYFKSPIITKLKSN